MVLVWCWVWLRLCFASAALLFVVAYFGIPIFLVSILVFISFVLLYSVGCFLLRVGLCFCVHFSFFFSFFCCLRSLVVSACCSSCLFLLPFFFLHLISDDPATLTITIMNETMWFPLVPKAATLSRFVRSDRRRNRKVTATVFAII